MGCSGPEGPSGLDAQGVDVTPPTIKMTAPWPLSVNYDKLKIAAAAVDNVAIERIVFTFDGSPYMPGLVLVDGAPPYEFEASLDLVTPGWHLIAARAYDLAGNIADAAPRPVWLGRSRSLSDTTVRLAYHNDSPARLFKAPDSTKSEAFWVRFTAAKRSKLLNVHFNIGGSFSDTTMLRVGVWSGSGTPTRMLESLEIPAVLLRGDPTPQQFNFTDSLSLTATEFFLVVELINRTAGDTLVIAADDGSPPWGRSGARDDGGWNTLSDRYSVEFNFLASCWLYYDPVPPDSGVSP